MKHHVQRHPRSPPNLRCKPLTRETLFQIRDPSVGYFKKRAPMPLYATFCHFGSIWNITGRRRCPVVRGPLIICAKPRSVVLATNNGQLVNGQLTEKPEIDCNSRACNRLLRQNQTGKGRERDAVTTELTLRFARPLPPAR
jgi:hypothetical protein